MNYHSPQPCSTPSLEDIVTLLKQSDKGKLHYCHDRKPTSYNSSLQSSPLQGDGVHRSKQAVQPTKSIFDMGDILSVLETVEEAAFADEEILTHYVNDSTTQKEIRTAVDKNSPPLTNILSECVEAAVDAIQENLQLEKDAAVQEKIRLFQQYSMESQRVSAEKLQVAQDQMEKKNTELDRKVQQYILESQESANRMMQENLERDKQQDRILKTRLQEAQERQMQKLRQGQARFAEGRDLFLKCEKHYQEHLQMQQHPSYQEFIANQAIVELTGKIHSSFQTIRKTFLSYQDDGIIEQSGLDSIRNVHQSLESLCLDTKQQLASLRTRKDQEDLERERLNQQEQEKQQRLIAAQKEKERLAKNVELSCPALPPELKFSVSRSAYQEYLKLKENLEKYEDISKTFTSNKDKQIQRMVMDLSKAVSLPVSSITSRSGSDIKSRLFDLNALLQGRDMKVMNRTVNTSAPSALEYTLLFMSKKFVKQAEGQVSSNHTTAFGLAFAMIGVWNENDTFGKLLMAQMHRRCPFIIPWYVPKMDGQSEVEYNKLRGYTYIDDDTVEPQDIYLKRMSGLIRTYAAIIQSPLPPGVTKHPHGIAHGWKWLTRMLNLDPWPEITATVLYDFLDVAGHALMATYKKQFEKLLYAISHDYFPKIEEVSKDNGGPVQRLAMFLKECIKLKKVRKPEGCLDSDFWSTTHHSGVVGS